MTTPREPFRIIGQTASGTIYGQDPHIEAIFENVGGYIWAEESEHGTILANPWYHHSVPTRSPRSSTETPEVIERIESKLDDVRKNAHIAIDVGLENRKILERLDDHRDNIGIGAIHSLDDGNVQLSLPLIYSYQMLEDEVIVGIEEFGIYGVGSTEYDAVGELQDEIWNLVQELSRMPPEKLGKDLSRTLKTLSARIQSNAVDA